MVLLEMIDKGKIEEDLLLSVKTNPHLPSMAEILENTISEKRKYIRKYNI